MAHKVSVHLMNHIRCVPCKERGRGSKCTRIQGMPSNLGTGSPTDPSQSILEETAPDLDSAGFKGLHHEDLGDVHEALGDVLEDCYQGQVEIAR